MLKVTLYEKWMPDWLLAPEGTGLWADVIGRLQDLEELGMRLIEERHNVNLLSDGIYGISFLFDSVTYVIYFALTFNSAVVLHISERNDSSLTLAIDRHNYIKKYTHTEQEHEEDESRGNASTGNQEAICRSGSFTEG